MKKDMGFSFEYECFGGISFGSLSFGFPQSLQARALPVVFFFSWILLHIKLLLQISTPRLHSVLCYLCCFQEY